MDKQSPITSRDLIFLMNYFLYARKSTDVEDKQVLSIEAQLSELRTLAKKEGLPITEEFVEKRTAKMPGRPVFNDMVKRIQKGEAQGIVCWKLTAPTCYQNDVRRKSIVIDRKKGKIVKEAFELYAKGDSRFEDISNFLYKRNVRSLQGNRIHKDRIKFILSNPFYYGHFRYNGEVHEGKHKSLIEKKLFDKVQKVMVERGRPMKPRIAPKTFCGLLHCGTCGMMITAEHKFKYQKNGNIHEYLYYRCSRKSKVIDCKESYIREEVLVDEINKTLSTYAMPSPWAKEFGLLMKEDEKKAEQESDLLIVDLRNKISTPSPRRSRDS